MGAFRELLNQAEAFGVEKLVWECDVKGVTENELAQRWKCRASGPMGVELTVIETVGRSGEEALREVVDFLRATSS